jgi:hypothetical protein
VREGAHWPCDVPTFAQDCPARTKEDHACVLVARAANAEPAETTTAAAAATTTRGREEGWEGEQGGGEKSKTGILLQSGDGLQRAKFWERCRRRFLLRGRQIEPAQRRRRDEDVGDGGRAQCKILRRGT